VEVVEIEGGGAGDHGALLAFGVGGVVFWMMLVIRDVRMMAIIFCVKQKGAGDGTFESGQGGKP